MVGMCKNCTRMQRSAAKSPKQLDGQLTKFLEKMASEIAVRPEECATQADTADQLRTQMTSFRQKRMLMSQLNLGLSKAENKTKKEVVGYSVDVE